MSDEKLKVCAERGCRPCSEPDRGGCEGSGSRPDGGKGPDLIYDCIGGPYAEPALRGIAWGGRYLVVGFVVGEIPLKFR